ncbi:hypothetical protein SNEBB_002576 [Seison nebaliae]|nr:hypothetical protein SNEBB_002576 [Seison nebaliae]
MFSLKNSHNVFKLLSIQCRFQSVAIIGSGPAAFYSAQQLLSKNKKVKIELFEKLPVPFGLIRYGVAPDHQEVKNCLNHFTRLMNENENRIKFYGNVKIDDRHVSLEDIVQSYDATILAYGASSEKLLGIPHEEKYINSAQKVISWYNGMPDMDNDKIVKDYLKTENLLIIGMGNVALDIGRILLRSVDVLRRTDIPEEVLEILHRHPLKSVRMIGRRTHIHSAFTTKELREISNLFNVESDEVPDDLNPIINNMTRPKKRLMELVKKLSGKTIDPNKKRFFINYLLSPMNVKTNGNNIVGLNCMRNNFKINTNESISIINSEDEELIKTEMIIRAIGYKGKSVSSLLPFDTDKGIVINETGNILGRKIFDNLYCSGWIGIGAIGILNTTENFSTIVGRQVVNDLEKKQSFKDPQLRDHLLKKMDDEQKIVSWTDWLRIDQQEISEGKKLGKVREKFISKKDIFQFLDK